MKLDIVTIFVTNLERSVSFYKDVLGLEEERSFSPREGTRIVFLKADNTTVELIEQQDRIEDLKESEECRVTIVFETEDLPGMLDVLHTAGIGVMAGPIEDYIFILDPDGLKIGIQQKK